MFTTASRLPLTPADTPPQPSPRPFVLRRLRPYPNQDPATAPARFELDPKTQSAIGFDWQGNQMSGPGDGKHRRTGTGTQDWVTTGNPGDGAGGTDQRPQQDQDED
jgi:putative ATP-grasp target RiPP